MIGVPGAGEPRRDPAAAHGRPPSAAGRSDRARSVRPSARASSAGWDGHGARRVGQNGPVQPHPTRSVVVLGSTGSIGTQALDVIARNPQRFRVAGLAAGGRRVDLLARQAAESGAEVVAVADTAAVPALREALAAHRSTARILAGPDGVAELAAWPCDVVLNGIDGALGLASTLAALEAGRTLALANKESLIMGGPLVKRLVKPGRLLPVDSEHS